MLFLRFQSFLLVLLAPCLVFAGPVDPYILTDASLSASDTVKLLELGKARTTESLLATIHRNEPNLRIVILPHAMAKATRPAIQWRDPRVSNAVQKIYTEKKAGRLHPSATHYGQFISASSADPDFTERPTERPLVQNDLFLFSEFTDRAVILHEVVHYLIRSDKMEVAARYDERQAAVNDLIRRAQVGDKSMARQISARGLEYFGQYMALARLTFGEEYTVTQMLVRHRRALDLTPEQVTEQLRYGYENVEKLETTIFQAYRSALSLHEQHGVGDIQTLPEYRVFASEFREIGKKIDSIRRSNEYRQFHSEGTPETRKSASSACESLFR